jgi:hypothetical protein
MMNIKFKMTLCTKVVRIHDEEMNIRLKISSVHNINSGIRTERVEHVQRKDENLIPTGALNCGSRSLRRVTFRGRRGNSVTCLTRRKVKDE